jgi:hypothetical protein
MTTPTLSIGVLVASELFFRLPFAKELHTITQYARQPLKVIRSKHSPDERKEKLLLAYSFLLARASLAILGYLLLVTVPLLMSGYIEFGNMHMMLQTFASPAFILESLLLSLIYLILRKNLHDRNIFKSR